jgi:hypothetical protein
VVRTGNTVAWAFRGFNPHHKKDPSYYPLRLRLPILLNAAVSTAIPIEMLTWIVMQALTPFLYPWLYAGHEATT